MSKSKSFSLLAILFLIAGIYCVYTAYEIHQDIGIFVFSGNKMGKLSSDSEAMRQLEELMSKTPETKDFSQQLRKERVLENKRNLYIVMSIIFIAISVWLFLARREQVVENVDRV